MRITILFSFLILGYILRPETWDASYPVLLKATGGLVFAWAMLADAAELSALLRRVFKPST